MDVERVQAIAFSSMSEGTIPPEFIRSEKEQPAITTLHGHDPQIPTIDFSDPDEDNLTRLIAEASRDWGMFQTVNHAIPTDVINNLQKVGQGFFELPQKEKELYAKPPDSKSIEGYGTRLQKEEEGKKAWVDHLFHKIWPPSAVNYQFWPKNPPSYRKSLVGLYGVAIHGAAALSISVLMKRCINKNIVGKLPSLPWFGKSHSVNNIVTRHPLATA